MKPLLVIECDPHSLHKQPFNCLMYFMKAGIAFLRKSNKELVNIRSYQILPITTNISTTTTAATTATTMGTIGKILGTGSCLLSVLYWWRVLGTQQTLSKHSALCLSFTTCQTLISVSQTPGISPFPLLVAAPSVGLLSSVFLYPWITFVLLDFFYNLFITSLPQIENQRCIDKDRREQSTKFVTIF